MSHGSTIALLIVLLFVLLIVWLLRNALIRTRDAGEARAEDHDAHPGEAVWEVPGDPVELAHDEPPHLLDAEAGAPLPAAPQPLGPPDDLTRMKGLGPRAQARLNELGVLRFDQLAALSEADAERLDRQMGSFEGRLARDRWVEQARFLAAGDVPGFEAAFGKLG